MCDAFYERYKDELSHYDGFISTYAPSFCLLYEKFKKPVITVAPIRYEAPFWNNKERWLWFNDYLQKGIDNHLIIPVANNKCDKKYCEIYTERDWKHIPSLCEYTGASYNPKFDFFLYSSLLPIDMKQFNNLKDKRQFLQPGYRWQDVANFKGIVHIPYQVSTMSIFEQYTTSMPMIFPSYNFMLELRKAHGSKGVLNQLSWREVERLPPGSAIEYNNAIKDVNSYGVIENEKEWIKLADFYDDEWMPYIQYFNSFEELPSLLNNLDTNEISQNMCEFNKTRKQKVYHMWEETLKDMEAQ
jgi:hypothetical protein